MMTPRFVTAIALAGILPGLVLGQTCSPLERDCEPLPAIGGKLNCDFTAGDCNGISSTGSEIAQDGTDGTELTIERATHNPIIYTSDYFFFGRVEVEIQAAPGQGIVTTLSLLSDTLDEIIFDWLGVDDAQVQTSYFFQGDTSTYDRGDFHSVSDISNAFHTYIIEWTPDAIVWSVDGNEIRTQLNNGDGFPQTPMQFKFGTWVAGKADSPEGTIEWAGGMADFSDGPFRAYIKSLTITDYAGGDKPASGNVAQYIYTDRTGNSDSVEVIRSEDGGDQNNDPPPSQPTNSSRDQPITTKAEAESTSDPESTSSLQPTESPLRTSTSTSESVLTTSTSTAESRITSTNIIAEDSIISSSTTHSDTSADISTSTNRINNNVSSTPTGTIDPNEPQESNSPAPSPGLSTGAIGGIAVGVVTLLVILLVSAVLLHRRRSRRITPTDTAQPEHQTDGTHELDHNSIPSPWLEKGRMSAHEMEANSVPELDSSPRSVLFPVEMHSEPVSKYYTHSPTIFHELPAKLSSEESAYPSLMSQGMSPQPASNVGSEDTVVNAGVAEGVRGVNRRESQREALEARRAELERERSYLWRLQEIEREDKRVKQQLQKLEGEGES